MKLRKNDFQGGVFRRYLFSYLSIVLVVSLVLGVSLTMVFANQLHQSERELFEGRLALAADYVETQIEAMDEIRQLIKTGPIYHPNYLSSHVINDLELLDEFSRFSAYSPWLKDFYLWYQNTGKVYSANDTTYGISLFRYFILNKFSEEEFSILVHRVGRDDIHFQIHEKMPDTLLISLPLYFGTQKLSIGEGALIVKIKLNELRQMICEMTGADENVPFIITYRDQMLWGMENVPDDAPRGISTKGKVTLTSPMPVMSVFANMTAFQMLMIVMTAVVFLGGVVLAVFAAWRSYQPIRRIYGKFVASDQAPSNELQTIENLLHESRENASLNQRQLAEQLGLLTQQQAWLKQQLVMMLISGNSSPVVQCQIQQLGYEMGQGKYAIFFLHLENGGKTDDLMRDIEGFSDEEYTLYAAELQSDREYAILANFEEEEACNEILELLEDTLNARGIHAMVQISRACTEINGIASVAIEALNGRSIPVPADQMKTPQQEEDGTKQLLDLCKAGNTAQALALLDTLLSRIECRYPSYIMHIYMLNVLNGRLHAAAVQAGIVIDTEDPVLSPINPQELPQYMQRLVKALCASAAPNADAAPEEQGGGEAAVYIRENCLNPDISLSSTASALGISTKQVTRLLRAGINMTFKEYLVQLRMEAAKQILRDQSLSIAETAEKVGYLNISHFIKCFKEYAGVTPGEWKKIVNRQ